MIRCRLVLAPALFALLWVAPATARERIVALAPHLAELACAVGACDELVGVSTYTDAPPQAAKLPQIGSAYSVNLEQLLALRPTRVLVWDGGTSPATIAKLRDLGLPIVPVRARTLDAIADSLRELGAQLGHEAAGRAAATAYRRRLNALRARYAGATRLRAFYQTESNPAYTVNRDSPISAAMAVCGADNIFADLPTIAAAVSAEAVLARDPDVVIYTRFEDARAMAAYWARLRGARAADVARQVVIDAYPITRQSPRVLDGIEELCAGLERVRRDAR